MLEWHPIETAPKGDNTGIEPMILLACIKQDRVLWATAARWTTVMYGYIQCASRSGWATDYAPPTAIQHNRPKPSGEWLVPCAEAAPTHWAHLYSPSHSNGMRTTEDSQ